MPRLLPSLPLRAVLAAWRPASPPRMSPQAPPQAPAGPANSGAPVLTPDDCGGCGWFDSSHDLQCGLCVLEHGDADTQTEPLPLGDWLQQQLAGWAPTVPH